MRKSNKFSSYGSFLGIGDPRTNWVVEVDSLIVHLELRRKGMCCSGFKGKIGNS